MEQNRPSDDISESMIIDNSSRGRYPHYVGESATGEAVYEVNPGNFVQPGLSRTELRRALNERIWGKRPKEFVDGNTPKTTIPRDQHTDLDSLEIPKELCPRTITDFSTYVRRKIRTS